MFNFDYITKQWIQSAQHKQNNPNEKWKILIVFDDMIADILINQKLNTTILHF